MALMMSSPSPPIREAELGFFLFLTFFNNILSLTHIGFYLQGVARLVAPGHMARQIVSVAPVHVARQCGHAGCPSSAAPRLR